MIGDLKSIQNESSTSNKVENRLFQNRRDQHKSTNLAKSEDFEGNSSKSPQVSHRVQKVDTQNVRAPKSQQVSNRVQKVDTQNVRAPISGKTKQQFNSSQPQLQSQVQKSNYDSQRQCYTNQVISSNIMTKNIKTQLQRDSTITEKNITNLIYNQQYRFKNIKEYDDENYERELPAFILVPDTKNEYIASGNNKNLYEQEAIGTMNTMDDISRMKYGSRSEFQNQNKSEHSNSRMDSVMKSRSKSKCSTQKVVHHTSTQEKLVHNTQIHKEVHNTKIHKEVHGFKIHYEGSQYIQSPDIFNQYTIHSKAEEEQKFDEFMDFFETLPHGTSKKDAYMQYDEKRKREKDSNKNFL